MLWECKCRLDQEAARAVWPSSRGWWRQRFHAWARYPCSWPERGELRWARVAKLLLLLLSMNGLRVITEHLLGRYDTFLTLKEYYLQILLTTSSSQGWPGYATTRLSVMVSVTSFISPAVPVTSSMSPMTAVTHDAMKSPLGRWRRCLSRKWQVWRCQRLTGSSSQTRISLCQQHLLPGQ